MVYTYQDYWLYGIVIPAVMAVVLLAIAIGSFIFLRRRQKGIFTQIAPLMAVLVSYIVMICMMYSSLDYLEFLPHEKQYAAIHDVILTEKVEKASLLPLFYRVEQGTATSGSVVTSNRGKYFVIDAVDLNPGQYVEVTYLPYSHAILTWKPVSTQHAVDYWNTHPIPTMPPLKIGYQKTGHEAAIIFGIFFLITLKVVPIEFFIVPLMRFLWKQDINNTKRIKPRLFGVIEKAYTEMVFIFGCVYSVVVNTYIVAFVCFVLSLGYGYYFLEIISTRASFSEDVFHFQSISTHLTIKKENIVDIRWEDRRKEYGKTLAVVLANRRILSFLIVDFVGLKDFIEWYDQDTSNNLGDPY